MSDRPRRPGLTQHLRELVNDPAVRFANRSPDIFVTIQPDRTIYWVNATWERVLGYAVEETFGERLDRYLHPEDLDRFKQAVQLLNREDLMQRTHFRMLKQDGGLFSAGVRATFFNNEKRANLVIRDASMQMAFEAHLERERRRFEAMLDHALIGVALLDERGVVLYESPASIGLLGYAPAEMVGRNIFDFVDRTERGRYAGIFASLLKQPDSRRRTPAYWRHAEGNLVPMVVHAMNKLHDPDIQAIVINYWRSDQPIGFE